MVPYTKGRTDLILVELIVPVPKKPKPVIENDYRAVALSPTVKCMEKEVFFFLKTCLIYEVY